MEKYFGYKLFEVGGITITGFTILTLLAAILITYLLLFIFKRSLLNNPKLNVHDIGRRTSIYILIKYLTLIFLFTLCIRIVGFEIGILLAGSAALLVGLGFGLQGIFYDLISGIIMLVERKIRVGDILELKDTVGKVKEISLRTSTIITRDEVEIIVPNHKFISDDIINTSYNSFCRRFRIDLTVGFNEDIEKVKTILIESALKFDIIMHDDDKHPRVRLSEFGEHALHFQLLYYTKEVFRIGFLKSDLRMEILKRFREENIKFPSPSYNLNFPSNTPSNKTDDE
ncbi:MAG: mechanosensitive ion channel [Bacteroidota bacterium]|nr:mechanosensitive ion channel [Bacteroidota bacterium]